MEKAITITVASQKFEIVLHEEAEKTFKVFVPSLPGCITYGTTIEEAIEMSKEAIAGYLEVMKDELIN